jgi:hypothetical protein
MIRQPCPAPFFFSTPKSQNHSVGWRLPYSVCKLPKSEFLSFRLDIQRYRSYLTILSKFSSWRDYPRVRSGIAIVKAIQPYTSSRISPGERIDIFVYIYANICYSSIGFEWFWVRSWIVPHPCEMLKTLIQYKFLLRYLDCSKVIKRIPRTICEKKQH